MSKILMMMMRHRLHNCPTSGQQHHALKTAADQCCADVVEDVESPRQPTTSASLPPSRLGTSADSVHVLYRSASQSGINGVLVQHCPGGGIGGGYVRWWRHKAEDCLWLASAFFILYYGDFRSDFFTLLAHDARVLRTPLHMGLVCLMLDVCAVVLYVAMVDDDRHTLGQPHFNAQENNTDMKSSQHLNMAQAPGVNIQVVMLVIGSSAFILMCVALWPIWRFLTIPMLFTLLMAITVVAPYVAPICSKVQIKLDQYLYSWEGSWKL